MKPQIRPILTTLSALTLSALLAGCAWSIGDKEGADGAKVTQPTKGDELLDLKKAYDQGAITEQQYQDQKQRVLDRP
jgi:hypothetical protein